MKRVRVFLYIILIGVFNSCSTSRILEYHIPNDNASLIIQKEIDNLSRLNKKLILALDRDNSNNTLTLIPTTNQFIQNFNIKHSNRVIDINGKKYNIVFRFDYELGTTKKKINEDGKETIEYHRKVFINEYAVKLYFDRNWNFLRKE